MWGFRSRCWTAQKRTIMPVRVHDGMVSFVVYLCKMQIAIHHECIRTRRPIFSPLAYCIIWHACTRSNKAATLQELTALVFRASPSVTLPLKL